MTQDTIWQQIYDKATFPQNELTMFIKLSELKPIIGDLLSQSKQADALKKAYTELGTLFVGYFDASKGGYSESEFKTKREYLLETIGGILAKALKDN